MKHIRIIITFCALAFLGAIAGRWLSSRVVIEDESVEVTLIEADTRLNESRAIEVPDEAIPIDIEYPESAKKGELVIQFSSREEYARYLDALARAGLYPLGQIDRLLAVRVGTDTFTTVDPREFEASPSFSFEVQQPLPPVDLSPEALASLRGFGVTAQQIVGGELEGDGAGILVAVLDSGLEAHPMFDDVTMSYLDLTGEGVSAKGAGHGTSVASIISGKEGVAPNAELFVVRVLDGEGVGNSFQVAEGIVRAVDAGAHIINLSLAVYQDSPILRESVRYAQSQGVLMVAAAGNDGYTRMPYPAAYSDVLSVTAVDANQRYALFPNQSEKIDIAAPGVAIVAAEDDENTTYFTGTSAAAPFVTGTLAAMLSADTTRTPQQTVDLLKGYLNDAGGPGEDPVYGDGVIDWDRLRERDTTGLLDLALADVHMDSATLPGTTMPIEVTVQNRGTQWSSEAKLEVAIGEGEPLEFSIGALAPGAITTRKVFTQVPMDTKENPLGIQARVLPDDVNTDVRLENNVKGVVFRAN
ncbi:MAG: S8 family peptidase [Opitutaceae bacterium]